MEFPYALKIMRIEKECVIRNATGVCKRECAECDLVQKDTDLIEAYQMAEFAITKLINQNRGYKQK